jgi:hypothetical protein
LATGWLSVDSNPSTVRNRATRKGGARASAACRRERAEGPASAAGKEVSLLGATICNDGMDRVTLFAKAAAALFDRGQSSESANRQLQDLWELLEKLL